MTSKLSKQAILYCTALGAVILIAAVLSRGQYIMRIIPVATGMFIAGPGVALSYNKKGKIPESECDEREMIIVEKAMKVTFFFMSFVLFGYWSYDTSQTGMILSFPSLLLILLWSSFIAAYAFYKKRH
ncbi:MAG: hypothetical protein FIA99_07440 [Ruminiclostridium sp.]|nr:hypothetical protein [Ruminiclostridium sp.]